MNLSKVLQLNGLNRNTYNTLIRRNGRLPFMEMETDPDAGRDKFSAAHALALGCVLALQRKGLPGEIAAEVVGHEFMKIWELLEVMVTGQARRTSSHRMPFVPGHWLKVGVLGDPPRLQGWALDGDENSEQTRTWLGSVDAIYAINVRQVAVALSENEQRLSAIKIHEPSKADA